MYGSHQDQRMFDGLLVFALIGIAAMGVAVLALIWWLVVHVRLEWVG